MQFIAVEMVIITNSLIKHCSIPLSGHFYDRIFFATLVVVRFFSLLSVNKILGLYGCTAMPYHTCVGIRLFG